MTRLTGSTIMLVPMTLEHVDSLTEVGLDASLWTLQPRAIRSRDDMRRYVEDALEQREKGEALPFVIALTATGQIVGTTRLFDIARPHRRAEIGATWITPAYQRSSVNTEAKLLLLGLSFDSLDLQKVVLKTELLNRQSQNAIERLGAVKEGIFKKHLIAEDGRIRDMVYYAIFATDWPQIRQRLTERLKRGTSQQSGV